MTAPRRLNLNAAAWLALGGAAALVASTVQAIQPGSGALAQRSDDGGLRPVSLARDLRRVEAGVADTGPLSTSLRSFSADLSVPDAFRDVYRVQSGPRTGQFARVSGTGGVTAVYPRGVYTNTGRGLRADIPNDTVFYIDGIPGEGIGSPPPSDGSGAISLRLDPRVGGHAAVAPASERIDPSITAISTRVTELDQASMLGSRGLPDPEQQARARATAREQLILEREAEFFERGARLFTDAAFRAERVAGMFR